MSSRITIKDLEQKQKAGTIRGYNASKPLKNKNMPAIKKRSAEKEWMEWNLMFWCNEHGFQLVKEFQFSPHRRFRFDFFIPALRCGLEYNGIFSEKSRHTTVTGYSVDMQKINLAQQLNFTVLQFTPLTYKTMVQELNKLIQ